jgi:CRP-like cAMP-binding protein
MVSSRLTCSVIIKGEFALRLLPPGASVAARFRSRPRGLGSPNRLTEMAPQGSRPASRRESDGGPTGPLDDLCGPPVEYPPGVTLFRQDELPRTIFLISRGLVKHVRSVGDGREAFVALRTVTALVGSSSAVTGDPHVTTASTLTRCTLRTIEAPALRRALEADSAISQIVHRMHAREIREQFFRSADATLPAVLRLERLLAGFIRDGLTATGSGHIRLDTPLSHEEMGQIIGVSRGHVSRLFARLEAKGLVHRRKDWIFIPPHSPLLKALDRRPNQLASPSA